LRIDDRGQALDLQFDLLRRIFGKGRAFRDDDGDGLSDIADFARSDDRLNVRRDGGHRHDPCADRRHGRANILCRQDGVHARTLPGGRDIDFDDAAMGDGASEDRRVKHSGLVEVGDKLTFAAQKPQILEALDGASDIVVALAHRGAFAIAGW